MQRTRPRSRSRTSRRSCGVEAGVVQQRGGAADPRRDEDVAGRLAPAAGRRAPDELAGAGVEPVLGLDALAGEVALGVDDGLGLARGAAGERDEARVLGVELDRRGGAAAYSASSGIVRTGQSGPAASSSPRLRSSHTIAAGFATSRRSRRSRARSCSVQGRTTAPMRKHATIVSTHSGRLPTSVRTTSPRPTPWAASAPASAAERSETSPNDHSRRPPSRSSATSARRAGSAASTRSRAKFMRPGTLVARCRGRPEPG